MSRRQENQQARRLFWRAADPVVVPLCDIIPKALPHSTSPLADCQVRCWSTLIRASKYLRRPSANFGMTAWPKNLVAATPWSASRKRDQNPEPGSVAAPRHRRARILRFRCV
jgi:hypothetical protein